MHIPDGYLSPASCVTLYGLSSVSWYSALQRIKRNIASRTIPLISVFAAFTFVIMMFNLPLPGGTTGHATGVAIATIVLGPAASIIAVSIALALQALLFGDGGISTLGANAFNMAVVGSLVACAFYRLIAGSSLAGSRRRVLAAALAGYLSCNVAALAAAFELGIQPVLYHDPSGTPLYAPYPLRIALPAIMIGHLTIAGLAASFYVNWKIYGQLQTVKAFLESNVFAEAVAACETAQSTTPFKWNSGTNTRIVGLNSVKLDKYRIIPSYTLFADAVYCDYDPGKKRAEIGSNFLERE